MVLAFAVNISFQLAGFVLFRRLAVADALTVGLVSGNRNVTLVWPVPPAPEVTSLQGRVPAP